MGMDAVLEQLVRNRAGAICEYCRFPQSASRFKHILDHVIARQHGGLTDAANLALCCGRCNLCKGPNIAGIDPTTRVLTRLYNPRTDDWHEHFRWSGALLEGVTPVGRTTVLVLNVNHRHRVAARQTLIRRGLLQG